MLAALEDVSMGWIETPRGIAISAAIFGTLVFALAAWTGYGIAQNAPSVVVVIVQR